MIEFLSGRILKKLSTGLILDVQGVGYGLDLPLPTLCELGDEATPLSLWVFTRVREDAIKLYGFATQADRDVFAILLNVNGVGPKMAIAILSTLTAGELRGVIEQNAAETLELVPGIGKRTAEKILLELKSKLDKFPKIPMTQGSVRALKSGQPRSLGFEELEDQETERVRQMFVDLKSALQNLGFTEKDLAPVLKRLQSQPNQGWGFSQILRQALNVLGERRGGPAAGMGPSSQTKAGELPYL